MPLSKFQKQIFALLKKSRNPESYVAGGTAIHRAPKSLRYSSDIDFFHDTDEAVTAAFQSDTKVLEAHDFVVKVIIAQPSFYRVIVTKEDENLRLEWVRDTAFRFFPVIEDDELGYRLHDADLVINKCLALANRSEIRDAIDMMELHKNVLSISATVWAACGKDPGFTPDLIINFMQKNATFRSDQLAAEALAQEIDPVLYKQNFLKLMAEAKEEIQHFDPSDLGCLYLDKKGQLIHNPAKRDLKQATRHYGCIKGSWPRIVS